jgi:hypothetical protein
LDQIFIKDDVEDDVIMELVLDESEYFDDPAGLDDGYNE